MAVTVAVPVITVDGPAAAGKGTIAEAVAAALDFHYLDSGKMYRAAALAARDRSIAADDNAALARLFRLLADDNRLLSPYLRQKQELTRPAIGQQASQLAAHPDLRRQLLPLQRGYRLPPGLVADGRDMATVVFPDACLRVFLDAALSIRAERRQQQLHAHGMYAKIADVCADMATRDQLDLTRAIAPLKPHHDALVIDATHQSISDIVASILRAYRNIASHPTTAES